jgi:hypothetical protein
MQCDNCGYIFFQPSKKCNCCSAPYASAQSAFDVGQENLFTIFEMAAGEGGIPSGMGMTESAAGVEDYNFTDDFDTGETEYGVDENVLDLSDAETEGFGIAGAMGANDFEFDTSGIDGTPSMDNAGPDNFDLNIPDDLADSESVLTGTLEVEPADEAVDLDFEGGFDEVEGLGFETEESPAAEAQEGDTAEISMDIDLEPEISLEPELDIDDDEPSFELSDESGLDLDDEQPSLELSEEPSLELSEELDLDMGETDVYEEEPSLELPEDLDLSDEPELMDTFDEPELMDASEEPELMDVSDEPELMDAPMEESVEMEDDGGIDFDLDGVDLDDPEEVAYEVPEEAETGGEEPAMDFDGLELEMETPDEPEDEELTQ